MASSTVMTRARQAVSGTFRRGFVSTFTLDVASRIFSALAVVIFVRDIATRDYAFIVLALAAGQFAGSAATGGTRMLYLRTEAERVSRGVDRRSDFASCAATQIVAVIGCAVIAVVLTELVGVGDASDRLWLVASATLVATGLAMTELSIAHLQAHLMFARAGLVGLGRGGSQLLIALLALADVRSGHTLALLTGLASLLVGATFAAPIAASLGGSPRIRFRHWLFSNESRWLTLYYVGSAAFATIDVFLIAALLTTRDVAAFGAAQRYYAVALGALPALIAVFRVRTLQTDVVDYPLAQRTLLLSWIRRLALPAGITTAAVAVVAPFAIPLVDGGRYPSSVPVFELLLMSAYATYLVTPAPSILMSQRRFRLLALLVLATVLANGIGDVIAATTIGLVGVAGLAVAVDLCLSAAMVFTAIQGASPKDFASRSLVGRGYRRIRNLGLRFSGQIEDLRFDLTYHVHTRGLKFHTQAGGPWEEAVHYQPVPPKLLRSALRALPMNDPEHFVFVDLGGGKGRAALIAARKPFARVISVELDPELAQVAAQNMRRGRFIRERRRLEVVTQDAASYDLPGVPVVVYMFNPFGPATMTAVLSRIAASVAADDRPVYVVYTYASEDQLVIAERCLGLQPVVDVARTAIFDLRSRTRP
jgi:O-antigen/teichoic acid export membrane protein/predicted RNA methylase